MKYTCPNCHKVNEVDMHDDTPASKLGKLSAKKRFAGKTKKEKSAIMADLAKKRWKK